MPEPSSADVANLLQRARESLDDARLLAERRRRNEIVLTRLALHQALQAISVHDGLDANDDLRLDTLLKRVPGDHPQAGLIERLRDDEARTIAAVAELVEALGRPAPQPPADTGPAPVPYPRDASSATPAGLTALELSPQGHGRSGTSPGVPSTQFWALIDRWAVADLDALTLIGHQGGLTRKGTRPRFRLDGEEAARFSLLRALDTALSALGREPRAWLRAAQAGGGTPIEQLRDAGGDGARMLLRTLTRQGLAAGLEEQGRAVDPLKAKPKGSG